MAGTVSVERVIRGEADQLSARFADVTRMPEWSPEPVSATWLVPAGPLAIAEWSYTFEPVGQATVVVESRTDRRKALARLVLPPVTGVTDRRTHKRATMEQTLDTLERHAEATARP